jgi:hypothetical protein
MADAFVRSLRGDSTPKSGRQRLEKALTVDESSLKGLRSEMGAVTPRKARGAKETPADAVSRGRVGRLRADRSAPQPQRHSRLPMRPRRRPRPRQPSGPRSWEA